MRSKKFFRIYATLNPASVPPPPCTQSYAFGLTTPLPRCAYVRIIFVRARIMAPMSFKLMLISISYCTFPSITLPIFSEFFMFSQIISFIANVLGLWASEITTKHEKRGKYWPYCMRWTSTTSLSLTYKKPIFVNSSFIKAKQKTHKYGIFNKTN